MIVWEVVLLLYRCLDVVLPDGGGGEGRLVHALSDLERDDALSSFECLPRLVTRLSGGQAGMRQRWVAVDRCLDSLTAMGEGLYWPSPSDTRSELDRIAPSGSHDSVFVLWPQTDLSSGVQVPSGGWGLAIGATDWSNGATYATVANASSATWSEPVRGEVWLHEWLHGVCDHFRSRGFRMPPGDADAGERCGYRPEAGLGWSRYYGDLMTGQVQVGRSRLGISPEVWRSGSPRVRR